MDIPSRISELRNKYDLSQGQLSKLSGLSQAALSVIESGKKQPTVNTIEKICSAFGISLIEFFSNKELEYSPELNRLIKNAKNLTPEQLDALNHIVRVMK